MTSLAPIADNRECADCGLMLPANKPHLSAIHCTADLRALLDKIKAGMNQQQYGLRLAGKALWRLVSDHAKGATLVISNEHWRTIPKGADVQLEFDQFGNLDITPSVPTENKLPA